MNAEKFALLTASRALQKRVSAAKSDEITFFDRSFIDQICGLERAGHAVPAGLTDAAKRLRFSERVFFVPPWPEIFGTDAERKHSFDEAEAEYFALIGCYSRLGYTAAIIPKASVQERAEFMLNAVTQGG